MEFANWFSQIAGTAAAPHDWQAALAASERPRSQLIRVPTGMGKTLGVLSAWSWNRLKRQDERWPRRLVWCLPMRVLVEQTESVAREALDRLGLLWDPSTSHIGKVGVHQLMGGADPSGEWNLFPDKCAVLIGTQDMLLSRALNRGYAAGRARWPQEFGLLSQDSLWVMDEVQLMDVGLATSAQLQAFHDDDSPKSLRPKHTWWMSATLQPAWLESVDTRHRHPAWVTEPTTVTPEALQTGLGSVQKSLTIDSVAEKDAPGFAHRIVEEHGSLLEGDYGRITLVVCNTVGRARRTFDEVRKQSPGQEVHLVHGRFRPAERRAWREAFLSRDACRRGVNRIIIATQVVEAGVDISAGCLMTELAPWSSLVQRFGRCARYGGAGKVAVVDRGTDEKAAAPYSSAELLAAVGALQRFVGGHADVGIARLEEFESGLDTAELKRLYPYEPKHLIIRREFDELFDTTPDLTGADIDISRFVRASDDRDLQVFWLGVSRPATRGPLPGPSSERQPNREELCAVRFLTARDWLCGEESKTNRKPKLRNGKRAWVWDWLDGEWVIASRSLLNPGRIVCVSSDSGGYDEERGFDAESSKLVAEVQNPPLEAIADAQLKADATAGGDEISQGQWKTIGCHADEVVTGVEKLANNLGLPADVRQSLMLAARWHDVGKSHPAFQGAICSSEKRPNRQDLAKAPPGEWLRPPGTYRTSDRSDSRPGLRHELASALALFAVLRRYAPDHDALLGPWSDALRLSGQAVPAPDAAKSPSPMESEVVELSALAFDLVVYLVAAHHGKVRVSLHASPKDQDYLDYDGRGLPVRGIREGDRLPSVALSSAATPVSESTLSLQPATLGLSPLTGRSWRERCGDLVARFGPGGLAFLESVIVAADRQASRSTTADPALATEAAR